MVSEETVSKLYMISILELNLFLVPLNAPISFLEVHLEGTLSCNWFEYFCTRQPGNRNQHSVRHCLFYFILYLSAQKHHWCWLVADRFGIASLQPFLTSILQLIWSWVLQDAPVFCRLPLLSSYLSLHLLLLFLWEDMRSFDELRKLEMFFKEETKRGCSVIDLYELVQHAGNILPRLWVRTPSLSANCQSVWHQILVADFLLHWKFKISDFCDFVIEFVLAFCFSIYQLLRLF